MIGLISSLLYLFRLLETQGTHKAYVGEFFFLDFIFKIDHKERRFGNASSVNFEFLFLSGVPIAICAQNLGSPYSNVE